ncbi:hypothetical protein AB7M56_006928 [Bradyrhizobium elkanii]|nr:hypothetical protein [Bradyrhizobium elkanii]MCS3520101.1 hypothetical protein [Bradyrhizobium elkanii]MCS4067756.1 hypothetical protein [Bradyrhizobium elkanii]MCS4083292.1 hypothetical protein [Bradyrhizobium elkanii]MCS4105588.1 hypothetical protein [Bradyrhizobium elkanii]
MPQENEKCCRGTRIGAVKFSFQSSRNELYALTGVLSITNWPNVLSPVLNGRQVTFMFAPTVTADHD